MKIWSAATENDFTCRSRNLVSVDGQCEANHKGFQSGRQSMFTSIPPQRRLGMSTNDRRRAAELFSGRVPSPDYAIAV